MLMTHENHASLICCPCPGNLRSTFTANSKQICERNVQREQRLVRKRFRRREFKSICFGRSGKSIIPSIDEGSGAKVMGSWKMSTFVLGELQTKPNMCVCVRVCVRERNI